MYKAFSLLFFLLLITPTLWGQEANESKLLSMDFQEVKVQRVLKAITKQSGLDFSYNAKKINVKQIISFAVENSSLENTLQQLTSALDISFDIIENQIILFIPKSSNLESTEEIYHTLSGFLIDQSTGENLIGATVEVLGTSLGAITNEFGYYVLQLPQGEQLLSYSYIGYEMQKEKINLTYDFKKDVKLKVSNIELPGVLVALPLKSQLEKRNIDKMEMRPIELENMPEFGGESGLVRGLQALPGIKIHGDASAFFFTRGGLRDQNLIIIDDAPIYNPSHLFGLYSVVIPDFTKSIQVYKGNIPANLGDRISSIVNIRTKDGNLNQWDFSGALNPLINRFTLEGPIVKKKGAVFLSFRRSNFKWLYQQRNPNASLGFGDFNFKWNHKFRNKKDRLFFTMISSSDEFINDFGNASGITWGNFAATLRWNHIFGPKLFTNTILYTGNYLYRLRFAQNSWDSGISSLSFKTDFTHFINAKNKARFGFETHGYFFTPGTITNPEITSFLPNITNNYSRKNTLYYQLNQEINAQWEWSAGVRIPSWQNLGPDTYYTFDDEYQVQDTINVGGGVYNGYVNVDPRVSLQYNIDSSSNMNFNLGSYHQYLQLITNSTSPFNSFEVWLPANPNIRPQQAFQVSMNYLKYFTAPKLSFSAAAYFKKLNHQIDYAPQANTLINPLIEGEFRFGNIRSYGLEVLLKKESGKLNGWISYTLSRAIRQTEDINQGRAYPAFQDRPHDFSLLLNYNISRRVLATAYWTSFTGSAFSSPTGFFTYNNQQVPIYDEKNNDRLPNYHRLDLSMKFILNKKVEAKYQHSLTFSIYNALAHKNIIDINFNKSPLLSERPQIPSNLFAQEALFATQTDLIRFFPSLTYKFKI